MAIHLFPVFGAGFEQKPPLDHQHHSETFWKLTRKNRVLSFSQSFRYFPQNKSSKQNAETRQARPQLYFATKIIKIHLPVLENELIEVCMLFLKS